MAQDSKIEWTNHTLNLWWGCTPVHAGCDHCYADALSHRWGFDIWGNDKPRRMIKKAFSDLDKFQRLAFEAKTFHRVFIGSMMDIFEKSMPLAELLDPPVDDQFMETDDLRQELFSRITVGMYPNLIMLFLTKRPSNIPKYVPAGWLDNPPANVMYGTSASDQEMFPARFQQLLYHCVEGLSYRSNPKYHSSTYGLLKQMENESGQLIDWIIQGGESGPKKRPFDLKWAYSMRDQCASWGIPYFFKQIDKVQPIPESLQIRQFP